MASKLKSKAAPSEKEQYLPDPETGGTMEPERNGYLDERLIEYLEAKDTIAECRETMKQAREQMIAICMESDIRDYRISHLDQIYHLEIIDETVAKLQAVKTE